MTLPNILTLNFLYRTNINNNIAPGLVLNNLDCILYYSIFVVLINY